MARPASSVATIDPTALAASIPVDSEPSGSPMQTEVTTISGESLPPMITHEGDPQPPASRSPGRRPGAFAPPSKPTGLPNTGPPQAKKELDRMLPSGLRVQVYKRGPAGKLGYIEEYSPSDVAGAGTIEVFIKRHVVPDYGYGEFHLYRHDGRTEPQAIGSVTVEAPLSARNQGDNGRPMETTRDILKMAEELATKQIQQQPVQKSPLEEMTSMMATMKQLGLIPDKKDTNGHPVQQQGMDPMAMMMFFQMQQQQKQPVGPDPLVLKLISKLEAMDENHRAQMQSLSIPMPLPPAPPPDPAASMAPILQMMQEQNRILIEAIRSSKPERDPVKDLADLRLLLGKEEQGMTPRDMLAMIPQLREVLVPQGNSDPFEKTIQNFRLFKLMQKEFGGDDPRSHQGGESAPEDNFWTFARGLFTSDVGKQIAAQMAAQIAGAGQQQQQVTRGNHRQMQAQEVAARRAAAGRQQQLQNQNPQQAQPRLAQPPVAAPPEQQGEQEQEITIPDGFLQVHAPAINNAASSPERVRALVESFQLLGTSPDFRPVIAKMFGLCKVNRKMEAIEHLKEILEFFSDNEILEKRVCELAVNDFVQFWKIIRSNLTFPDVPEVFPEGYTPPPAPVVVVSEGPDKLNGSDRSPSHVQPVPQAAIPVAS